MKNRIKILRKERGFTLDALADLIGTSATQVQRLETGERRLNVDWIEKISKALEVLPADIFSETENKKEQNEQYDQNILTEILADIEAALDEAGYTLDPQRKVKLMFSLYNRISELPPEKRRAEVDYMTRFVYTQTIQ